MTLQQFLNKYKGLSLSEYEESLLEQCFDKLNSKYQHDALIEQDNLYLTIKYIFDNNVTHILTVLSSLSESCIYELNRDYIPSIVDIHSENSNAINLLWSISKGDIKLFANYCFSIQYLSSYDLDINNLDLIRFACYCFEFDKGHEIIKNVILMRLDANKLNEFHDKHQRDFNEAIETRNISTLIKASIEK